MPYNMTTLTWYVPGPYPEAIERYTASIKLNPNDAKVGHGLPRLNSLASSLFPT